MRDGKKSGETLSLLVCAVVYLAMVISNRPLSLPDAEIKHAPLLTVHNFRVDDVHVAAAADDTSTLSANTSGAPLGSICDCSVLMCGKRL